MNSSDVVLARVLMDRNVEDARRMAGSHHLVCPTAKDQPGQSRLLGQLGAWLVALGQRLERYALVQPSLRQRRLEMVWQDEIRGRLIDP